MQKTLVLRRLTGEKLSWLRKNTSNYTTDKEHSNIFRPAQFDSLSQSLLIGQKFLLNLL